MSYKAKKIVIALFATLAVALAFTGYYYDWKHKRESLRANTAYTQGRIVKVVTWGTRYTRSGVYFEYKVQGKRYRRRVPRYNPEKQPALGGVPIRKGMYCLVAYDKTNPKIATIYQSLAR